MFQDAKTLLLNNTHSQITCFLISIREIHPVKNLFLHYLKILSGIPLH